MIRRRYGNLYVHKYTQQQIKWDNGVMGNALQIWNSVQISVTHMSRWIGGIGYYVV